MFSYTQTHAIYFKLSFSKFRIDLLTTQTKPKTQIQITEKLRTQAQTQYSNNTQLIFLSSTMIEHQRPCGPSFKFSFFFKKAVLVIF